MRILFISREKRGEVSSIVKNQASSLKSEDLNIEHYLFRGKGPGSYLRNTLRLRKFRKSNHFELYHAHYSITAMMTWFAGCKPMVASMMGSDIYNSKKLHFLTKLFIRYCWNKTIVKSPQMKKDLLTDAVTIVPNGVDLQKFKPIDRAEAIKISKLRHDKKHILFVANPKIPEKNYALAEKACRLIKEQTDSQLTVVTGIKNDLIPYFLNSADVLLLPSLWEGSPNVVKEALACNIPIVATEVGDVPDLLSGVRGCYTCTNDAVDVADKLLLALSHGRLKTGRNKIISLNLDEVSIANRLTRIYSDLLK